MRRHFLTLLCFVASSAAHAEITYSLRVDPNAGDVAVTIEVEDPGATPTFRIPAWCPGFYFLQSYERKITEVRATTTDGQALTLENPDPRAWRIANPTGGPVRLRYRVRGDDGGLGFFGVSVRPGRAFVNGPAAFMHLEGRLNERHTLALQLPAGWDVATGMEKEADRWVSPDYDEFIDHPLQLGEMTRRRFEVSGLPFEAVFVTTQGTPRTDVDAETERLRRLSEPAIRMFGHVPFKRYVYIIHLAVGGFAGGLEHRASCLMAVPDGQPLDIDSLSAHEFFHAWNVKQIRPKVLGPFDYGGPVRTANLWFAEGVTDYYAKLHVHQSGLQDLDWLLRELQSEIFSLQASRTRRVRTVEEASRGAWEHGGFGWGDLSYYTKGLVIGFILDAEIRAVTAGQKSLDDVLRVLYERHRLPQPGFEENAILETINEVSGQDLTALYRVLVRSTEEVPYDRLRGLGLRLLLPSQPAVYPAVTEVDGKVAGTAPPGLTSGETIQQVELDGESAVVTVVREGAPVRVRVAVRRETNLGYTLELDPFATSEARARREAWRKGSAPGPG